MPFLENAYTLRPSRLGRSDPRFATHAEVLAALKATAAELGLTAKLPRKASDNWRAEMPGLVVVGGVEERDGDEIEQFAMPADGVVMATLRRFAAYVAGAAGQQRLGSDFSAESWVIDKPKKPAKSKAQPKAKSKSQRKRS